MVEHIPAERHSRRSQQVANCSPKQSLMPSYQPRESDFQVLEVLSRLRCVPFQTSYNIVADRSLEGGCQNPVLRKQTYMERQAQVHGMGCLASRSSVEDSGKTDSRRSKTFVWHARCCKLCPQTQAQQIGKSESAMPLCCLSLFRVL